MAETKLKLVKNQKKQPTFISKGAEQQAHASRLTPHASRLLTLITNPIHNHLGVFRNEPFG